MVFSPKTIIFLFWKKQKTRKVTKKLSHFTDLTVWWLAAFESLIQNNRISTNQSQSTFSFLIWDFSNLHHHHHHPFTLFTSLKLTPKWLSQPLPLSQNLSPIPSFRSPPKPPSTAVFPLPSDHPNPSPPFTPPTHQGRPNHPSSSRQNGPSIAGSRRGLCNSLNIPIRRCLNPSSGPSNPSLQSSLPERPGLLRTGWRRRLWGRLFFSRVGIVLRVLRSLMPTIFVIPSVFCCR